MTNRRSVILRLLLPFALLIVMIVAVCSGVLYWVATNNARAQQEQSLDHLISLSRSWIGQSGLQFPNPTLMQRLQMARDIANSDVTVIDPDGVVRLDTRVAGVATMANHNSRPEVTDARATGRGLARRFSTTTNGDLVYLAEPLDPNARNGWIIRVSQQSPRVSVFGSPALVIIATSVLASLLAVSTLGRLLRREWVTPTQALTETVERMGRGDWNARAEPRGAAELQAFSTRLNVVSANAQRQLTDLRQERADLQALVDTLPDPVLVSDADGRFALVNSPASRLLDVAPSRAIGSRLESIISDERILELFDAVRIRKAPPATVPAGSPLDSPTPASTATPGSAAPLTSPATLRREIRLTRAAAWLTFQAFATPTARGGVLLVLRDISDAVSTGQMKTDFVANASHELRTPIAAIKIAFETLQDVYTDDPEQSERCIGVIDGHLKRLEDMLRDLMDLSRVENADQWPAPRELTVRSLMNNLRNALGPVARHKQVELYLEEDAADEAFIADEHLLSLVLKNLVENSIKFTPARGSVTVAVKRDNGRIRLSVADTGIGIPAEHIDRVFERFYQVDPARTGAAGRGTGLGLAIVKHATAAMEGTVSIRSIQGSGTTVICNLPDRQATSD